MSNDEIASDIQNEDADMKVAEEMETEKCDKLGFQDELLAVETMVDSGVFDEFEDWKPQWMMQKLEVKGPKQTETLDDASKPLILMQKEREKQTLNGVRRGAYVASTARQSRSDRNRNRTSGYRSSVRRRYHPFANAEK
eukprot:441798_1